jgi:hypothetical protein
MGESAVVGRLVDKWLLLAIVVLLQVGSTNCFARVRVERPDISEDSFANHIVKVNVDFATFDSLSSQMVTFLTDATLYTTGSVENEEQTATFVNFRPASDRIEIYGVWASGELTFSSSTDFGTVLVPLLEKAGIKCTSPNILYIDSVTHNNFHVIARHDGHVPGFEFDMKLNRRGSFQIVEKSYKPRLP